MKWNGIEEYECIGQKFRVTYECGAQRRMFCNRNRIYRRGHTWNFNNIFMQFQISARQYCIRVVVQLVENEVKEFRTRARKLAVIHLKSIFSQMRKIFIATT